MKVNFFIMVVLIIQINFIYASCSDGQVDINEASSSELEEIYGIGPVKAKSIIDSRPFEQIDDLSKVTGIGDKTLEGIKSQDLVCVNDEQTIEKKNKKIENTDYELVDLETETKITIVKQMDVIRLSGGTKDIKKEKSGENSNNYPYYGLYAFAVLLGFLFFMRRKKYTTEFDDG
jgi:competence ComEA-like helix-hairpin-helix protein